MGIWNLKTCDIRVNGGRMLAKSLLYCPDRLGLILLRENTLYRAVFAFSFYEYDASSVTHVGFCICGLLM